jgi:hypothetical protein
MLATAMISELLRFNFAYLSRTINGVSPEKFYIRPEGRGNPLIWILGHIVLNRGEIVELLGGDPTTRDLGDLFARGTKPQSDRSVYPAPQKLMTRFLKLASVTEHLLKNCNESLLDQKSWGQFDSLGQHLAYSYMHETHHIGQITYIVNLPSFKSQHVVYGEKKNSTTRVIMQNIKSVFSQT